MIKNKELKDRLFESKFELFKKLGYEVHHKEIERFHKSKARIKVCCAPRRTSKSYCAAHDILWLCLVPNARVWVVGPSYSLAEKEFRYVHDALVLRCKELGLPRPIECKTSARSGNLVIRWPWGAIIEAKSAERPESLLGEANDAVIYSEAAQLPRGIRERYVAPTLITRQGVEIIATTPDSSAEWVHELWVHGQEDKYDYIESFSWDISANPTYPREEFERAKKMYGEDSPIFKEQYLGEWVFYAGLVYPQFRQEVHVIEPFKIPDAWPRYRAIDFGNRDPFVCLWAAVGPKAEMYFYREYYNREGLPMKQHAENIKGYSRGEHYQITVGDSAATQSIEDLNYEGVQCVPCKKDTFSSRLKVSEYLMPTPDGVEPFGSERKTDKKYPRMYIFNTMLDTVREFKYYRWKEGRQVEGNKETAEGDDHSMDALRYLLTERPSPFKMGSAFSWNSFNGMMERTRNEKANEVYIGA